MNSLVTLYSFRLSRGRSTSLHVFPDVSPISPPSSPLLPSWNNSSQLLLPFSLLPFPPDFEFLPSEIQSYWLIYEEMKKWKATIMEGMSQLENTITDLKRQQADINGFSSQYFPNQSTLPLSDSSPIDQLGQVGSLQILAQSCSCHVSSDSSNKMSDNSNLSNFLYNERNDSISSNSVYSMDSKLKKSNPPWSRIKPLPIPLRPSNSLPIQTSLLCTKCLFHHVSSQVHILYHQICIIQTVSLSLLKEKSYLETEIQTVSIWEEIMSRGGPFCTCKSKRRICFHK